MIRESVKAQASTGLSGTSCAVSDEYPWITGDIPLYEKNLKKVYFDAEQPNITQNQTTLDLSDVFQTETRMNAFLCVNAKNQPSDIAAVIAALQSARFSVTGHFINECEVITEIEEDRITYTFEYRFVKIN